jgi:tetratricopeptide (TPR) repeat protein
MSEIKTRVIALLDRAYADQQAFIETVSEIDRAAVGTLEHWAIKDALSHIALWQRINVERVEAIARGDEPPNTDDYLAINDVHFEDHRDRSWADTLAETERVYRAMRDQAQYLSAEDLTDPQRFAQTKGRALVRTIVGNGFVHPEQHLAQLYVERGEIKRATQLQEEVATLLEDIPEERSSARYNLACFYALSGQTAQALTELAAALKSNPDLIEWSKQDSDLDSLRNEPAYQALYQPA